MHHVCHMNLFQWPKLARVSSCSLVVEHQPGLVTRIMVIGSAPARSTQIFFYLVACLGLSRNGPEPLAIIRDRVVDLYIHDSKKVAYLGICL